MTTAAAEIADLVKKLASAKTGGAFHTFIDFIQFPRYRNFQPGSRISFDFPVTVLVGQNGSGKTSLLHALAGAPHGKSTGNWWFGTQVDPIDTELDDRRKRKALNNDARSSYWYGYSSGGVEHQVLKTRIKRSGDPDYWEPSRPIARYGMKLQGGGRSPAIQMPVMYLNFKTQLNAFDRCFHFFPDAALRLFAKNKYWAKIVASGKLRSPRVQDYLRARSARLKIALLENRVLKSGRNEMNHPLVELAAEELQEVSSIVGKYYKKGAVLEHRFYLDWGTSVLFETECLKYSEAFAGSGEAAVARLVRDVRNAPTGSLVLLDEPETSLHPGAQEKLLLFLLRNSLQKKLQIVISTHAPAMVRRLPSCSIRVVNIGADGRVSIQSNVTADEAFFVLGHPAENQVQIIVEDVLAKILTEAVLQDLGPGLSQKVVVEFRPGGESEIKKDAAIWMLTATRKPYLLLDGDKKPEDPLFSINEIRITDSAESLDNVITKKHGVKVAFHQDSNMLAEDKRQQRITYMKYCNSHLRYLPFDTPEQAIWDDDAARQFIEMTCYADPDSLISHLASINDYKKKFSELARMTLPASTTGSSDAKEIAAFHQLLVTRFCNKKGLLYLQLRDLLKGIATNA